MDDGLKPFDEDLHKFSHLCRQVLVAGNSLPARTPAGAHVEISGQLGALMLNAACRHPEWAQAWNLLWRKFDPEGNEQFDRFADSIVADLSLGLPL